MANPWVQDRAKIFYFGFALVSLAAVVTGFSTTYILPIAQGSFSAPPIVHLHGALCLGWVLLLALQTILVRQLQTPWHRKLGYLGVPIALGVFVSGLGTATWATRRDLDKIPTAFSTMTGTLTSLTIFLALVIFGVAMRRRPDWHKRLLMLATVAVLWPAYFRFRHLLPWVPRPDIWLAFVLADLPIAVAAFRDRRRYGQIHPVWSRVGTALIAEQAFEIFMFETPLWARLGQAVFRAIG